MRAAEFDELAFFRAIQAATDDLIPTKRFADRPKDLEDIRMLRILRSESPS
jgi:hypothetical protein